MYITLETDYAVRIVSVLCLDGGRVDAATIAGRANVTLRFALKILRKLVAADIIRSYKGTQGDRGYILFFKMSFRRARMQPRSGRYMLLSESFRRDHGYGERKAGKLQFCRPDSRL